MRLMARQDGVQVPVQLSSVHNPNCRAGHPHSRGQCPQSRAHRATGSILGAGLGRLVRETHPEAVREQGWSQASTGELKAFLLWLS